MKEYPDYLYHYTSIENLALILKNKTIRFNSLINVDDPSEIKTMETDGIGKYCYCSCWTDEEESIPFWSMYTRDMHGVMIKMISFPFYKHEQFLDYYDNGKVIQTYIPKYIFNLNNVYTIPTIPFLRKIEYVEHPTIKVFDKIIKKSNGLYDFTGNMNEIGLYKTLPWSFQSEWRYSMVLLPHDNIGGINIDVSNNNVGLLQNYYDIEISEVAFNSMEIVIGPKANAGEKLLIETICNKYAPNINISNSILNIR
ncbi:MAG: hypothetical protein HFJ54_02570 [Clostridia bacterium]|nr:hypothetical protein [Clostridia bacterium]